MTKKDYYVPVEETFFQGVMAELAYAEDKHKSWSTTDAVHAASIITEEAGKLTRACNDYTFGLPGSDPITAFTKTAYGTSNNNVL